MDNQGTLSAADVIRSSVLDTLAVQMSDMTPLSVVIALLAALLAGIVIAVVYRRAYRGVLYSPSFAITLVMLTLITTPVVMCIGSNIALSMGMVGALSIVRFRTAIKEPSDIAFLFWAIAAGIVLAAGFIPLAVIGSLFIGLILLFFSRFRGFERPYILVLHCADAAIEQQAHAFLAARAARLSLKSKNVSPGCIELNYEIRLRSADTDFVNELAAAPGVTHAVLVAYNGEYMG